MDSVLFWILFVAAVSIIFPRVGNPEKYRRKAVYLDPSYGVNKFYGYDANIAKFYWGMLILGYTVIIGGYVFACFFESSLHSVNTMVWAGVFVVVILSLSGIPLFIYLLLFKFHSKNGLYIYEDKIVSKNFLSNYTFFKTDIEWIQFQGFILGFAIKLKDKKVEKRITAIGTNLPQQICTLSMYVSDDRNSIKANYDKDFLAYLELIRENRKKRQLGLPVASLKGLYRNKRKLK